MNTDADKSRRAISLNFGLSLHLDPYFVDASSEGLGESVHRLAQAFIAP